MEIKVGDFVHWTNRPLEEGSVCYVTECRNWSVTVISYYGIRDKTYEIKSDNFSSRAVKKIPTKLAFLILGEEKLLALLKEGTRKVS